MCVRLKCLTENERFSLVQLIGLLCPLNWVTLKNDNQSLPHWKGNDLSWITQNITSLFTFERCWESFENYLYLMIDGRSYYNIYIQTVLLKVLYSMSFFGSFNTGNFMVPLFYVYVENLWLIFRQLKLNYNTDLPVKEKKKQSFQIISACLPFYLPFWGARLTTWSLSSTDGILIRPPFSLLEVMKLLQCEFAPALVLGWVKNRIHPVPYPYQPPVQSERKR